MSSLPNCLIASLILRLAVNCVITRGFKGNGGTYENLLVAKTLLESSSHGKSVGCDTKPRTRLLRPPPSPVPFVPNWTDKKGTCGSARALSSQSASSQSSSRVEISVRSSINKSHLPIGIEIMIPFLVVCLFGVGAMRKVSLSGLAAEGRRRHRDNEWGTMFNSSDP